MAQPKPTPKVGTEDKGGDGRDDTVFVLNKESVSYQYAKMAIAQFEQGSLEGLSRQEMRLALAGKLELDDSVETTPAF